MIKEYMYKVPWEQTGESTSVCQGKLGGKKKCIENNFHRRSGA